MQREESGERSKVVGRESMDKGEVVAKAGEIQWTSIQQENKMDYLK